MLGPKDWKAFTGRAVQPR